MALGYTSLGFRALGSILPLTLYLGTFALLDLPSPPHHRGRRGQDEVLGVGRSLAWPHGAAACSNPR